jgi:predicted transcriptional regulator
MSICFLKKNSLDSPIYLTNLPITENSTPMPTLHRTSTTDMEVTSIRLERQLKERLKDLAGNQGYQALIREVLWNYVEQQERGGQKRIDAREILASVDAIAHEPLTCALTGQDIQPGTAMQLGWTVAGAIVPLKASAIYESQG